jgi:hypothetical protein
MSRLRRALDSWVPGASARVDKLRHLSRRERRLLVQSASLLPAVHFLQQAFPFRVWREWLEPRPGLPPAPPSPSDAPSADEIAWSVEVARRWVPGRYQCLPSAYAAHLLLHHYGHASIIHVGVSRDATGKVEAHAWVECEGRTLIGAIEDLARFIPLPPLSGGRRAPAAGQDESGRERAPRR